VPRQQFRFCHRLRVRWAEVDRQDIVFNGHYLTYFDVGMTEYCRAAGIPYPEGFTEAGTDLFAVATRLDYHGSATFDDLLDVCVRIARIGHSSIRFEFEIHRDQAHLVSGELVYVNADPATREAVRVPEFVREAVRRFEGRDPSGRD